MTRKERRLHPMRQRVETTRGFALVEVSARGTVESRTPPLVVEHQTIEWGLLQKTPKLIILLG
jgi:hypothetical protein